MRASVFTHGSASPGDSAGSMVMIAALTSWLAWPTAHPLCGYHGRDHGPTIPHSFSFHPPETMRDAGPLCSSVPLHLMLYVTSSPPCTLVSLLAGPHWLFLNYCIWNQLPNRAAKNSPSNRIIVMWVDELFICAVLVGNKTLNLFRKLEKER